MMIFIDPVISTTDGFQICATLRGTFHGSKPHGGVILLYNDPGASCLLGCFEDRREILLTKTNGTELKIGGTFGDFVLNSDQLVHIVGLVARKILQMNDRGAPAILHQILRGIFAAHVDPTHIQLGLKQVGGNLVVQNIQCLLAVQLQKLKLMVVIYERHSQLFGNGTQHGNVLYYLGELFCSGTILRD